MNGHSDRRPGDDSDAESSRETSSAGSSDCEAERRVKVVVDGGWGRHNLVNSNSQNLSRLTLRDKHPMSSSSDENEVYNSPVLLAYEYFEQEQPHHRRPLYDKVSPLSGGLHVDLFFPFSFILIWMLVALIFAPITNLIRSLVLHLNFQSSRCTEAVIYCLLVGYLSHGKLVVSVVIEVVYLP